MVLFFKASLGYSARRNAYRPVGPWVVGKVSRSLLSAIRSRSTHRYCYHPILLFNTVCKIRCEHRMLLILIAI